MYKTILNSSLLLAGMFFAGTAAQGQKITTTSRVMSYTIHPAENGAPEKEYIDITRDGKSYKMVKVGGRIAEFYVDGQRIPEDHLGDYRTIIKEIDEQIRKDKERAEQDEAQAREDRVRAEKDRALALIDKKRAEQDVQRARQDMELAEKDEARASGERNQVEAERDQVGKERLAIEKDKVEAERNQFQGEQDRIRAEQTRLLAERGKLQADQALLKAEAERMRADRDREEADKGLQFYKKLMKELIGNLVDDHIVNAKKDLFSLALSDDEMFVNGKKLPAEVHERYKKKYIRQRGMGLYYGDVKEPGNGVFMGKEDIDL